jgi:hypothetical protein
MLPYISAFFAYVFLFLMQTSKQYEEAMSASARCGPQLVWGPRNAFIRGRQGFINSYFDGKPAEAIVCLIFIYFLQQLSYPASFGQFLGVLQQFALGISFPAMSKKTKAFLHKKGFWHSPL